MVCDCCLKRKKFFESFAEVQTDSGIMHLCVDCNDLAYKIRDDANEGDKEKYNKHRKELEKRGKKARIIFVEWKKQFTSGLEKKFPNENYTSGGDGKTGTGIIQSGDSGLGDKKQEELTKTSK